MANNKYRLPPPPYPALRWVLRVFPWPFVIIGAVTLLLGVKTGWRAVQSRHWPSVNGLISSSKTVTEIQAPDRAQGDRQTRPSRTVDRAAIIYDYRVGDRTYAGSTVSFGDFGSSRKGHAGGIVTRYPSGKMVAVFYDPARPERAVLEPGFSWSLLLAPVIGLIFLIGGLVTARFLWRAMA